MTIKNILPLYADPKVLSRAGSGAKAGKPEDASFAAALQAAGGNAKSATALAQIYRLQSMRGALSIGDLQPEEAPSASSSFPLWSAYLAAGRKIDSHHGATAPGMAASPTRSLPVERPGKAPSAAPPEIDAVVARASRRYGVEPALIKAVIKAESAFDPKAVSPAGAEGLMQLMPGTARELGVEDSFDAEQNVMAGTRYLKSLLDRYDGDLDKTLAGYNWGPGNVARKGTDSLPEETRNYQARVKRYYDAYLA